MEISLKNFRCYKEKTFAFPLGVNLINGPSGKGKSTILHAIKYALYGKVQGVCSYGEKKTTVKLRMLNLDITRTNIPSRVVVVFQQNTYEDDAAQEIIHKRFGTNFDITSYMVQKGLSQFFNLSGSEKLLLLEELSLQGDSSIQTMKQSIQTELKDVRIKFMDEQSQLKVLEKTIKNVEFEKKQGIRTISDVKSIIQFLRKIKSEWDREREHNEHDSREYTKSIKKQQQTNQAHDTLLQKLNQLYIERDRLSNEQSKLDWSEDKLIQCKSSIRDHDTYIEFQRTKQEYTELDTMYKNLVQQERDVQERDIQSILSKQMEEKEDVQDLRLMLDKTLRIVEQKKRYEEIKKELDLDKYKDIDTKLNTTKKTIDRVKNFLSDMDTRKCVQSCPHCKKGLVIRSNQVHVSDNNALSETDKTKETDYRQKLPLLVKQEENQHRYIGMRDTLTIELNSINLEDVTIEELNTNANSYQERIEREQKNRTINESLKQQLNDKKRISPESKYKDMKKKLDSFELKLNLPKGTHCENIDLIKENLSYMESAKREEQRLIEASASNHKKIIQYETEQVSLSLDTTDYHSLLEDTMKRQQWITERQIQSSDMLECYIKYETSMNEYLLFKKQAEDIEEKQKLCVIYQAQLENLEKLFHHIIKAEGVCLEKFLQLLNNKLGWYMDEFFKDSSIKMVLDSEKECKSGKIRHEISVRILQNANPCELKSLSGGEYDRCALAFMLAINELSHSPCLFLDESISSLDMNLSEDVLEVIKEKFLKSKLVLLISHQANTGFFDHVVNL